MKTKGLSIQEAIQSGLPFKREKWAFFGKFEANLYFSYYDTVNNHNYNESDILTIDDLLATDWEIKVPEVTITREKLAEAWDKAYGNTNNIYLNAKHSDFFKAVAKELGL